MGALSQLLRSYRKQTVEDPNTMQFSISNKDKIEYYELTSNGVEWKLATLIGEPINIDLSLFEGKTKEEIKIFLRNRFNSFEEVNFFKF